jgi:hypothetical protein
MRIVIPIMGAEIPSEQHHLSSVNRINAENGAMNLSTDGQGIEASSFPFFDRGKLAVVVKNLPRCRAGA